VTLRIVGAPGVHNMQEGEQCDVQVYPGKLIFLSFDGNENYDTIRSY
jgi:hypothetical protein